MSRQRSGYSFAAGGKRTCGRGGITWMFRMPSGSGPPSRSLEGAGLVADPAFAAEDDGQQDDDHDQIDAEYGEQRDEHAVTISCRRLGRLTETG
jgi:hypothetical protein